MEWRENLQENLHDAAAQGSLLKLLAGFPRRMEIPYDVLCFKDDLRSTFLHDAAEAESLLHASQGLFNLGQHRASLVKLISARLAKLARSK